MLRVLFSYDLAMVPELMEVRAIRATIRATSIYFSFPKSLRAMCWARRSYIPAAEGCRGLY